MSIWLFNNVCSCNARIKYWFVENKEIGVGGSNGYGFMLKKRFVKVNDAFYRKPNL